MFGRKLDRPCLSSSHWWPYVRLAYMPNVLSSWNQVIIMLIMIIIIIITIHAVNIFSFLDVLYASYSSDEHFVNVEQHPVLPYFLIKQYLILQTVLFSWLVHGYAVTFLAYPTGISVNSSGARKCRLTWWCKTTLVHDVIMTIFTFWRQFWRLDVSFRQTFRRQRIREEPYRVFLDRKM